MASSFSRRRLLRYGASIPALAAAGVANARTETQDRIQNVTTDGVRARGTPGEQKGYAPSWSTTHVEERSTYVVDVVARVAGEGAVAVGVTDVGDGYDDRRVWIGAFGPSGLAWSKTLEANGRAGFPIVVSRDDHYVVFWDRPDDGRQGNAAATVVNADGVVLQTTRLDIDYSFFRDVHVEGDSFLALGAGWVYRITSDLSVAHSLNLPRPDEYGAGTDSAAIAPVSDGYVATGHALDPDHRKAFWAVKFDDASGSVQWNQTYRLSQDVNAYGGARAGEDRAVIVGEFDPSVRQQVAIGVDGDGTLAWKTTLEDSQAARFTHAVPLQEGIRAFGWEEWYEPSVATIDRDGTVQSRWRDQSWDSARQPAAAHPLGDGRYLLGGDTRAVDAGEDVDAAGWVARLQPNDPPTPSIAVSPAEPNATEQVTFDASETTDPDTSVEAYEWNLDGDEYAEQTGKVMERTFAEAGTYEVTFRAVDLYGAVGTETISLSVGENTAPSASVSVSRADPFVGDEVTLRTTELSDAETSVESVVWDFDGDGEVDAEGTEVTTTFSTPGEKEVAATVTDTAGKSATVSSNVNVQEATAKATATPTSTATEPASGEGSGDESTGPESGSSGREDADGSGGGSDGPMPGFGVGATVLALSGGALARFLRDD